MVTTAFDSAVLVYDQTDEPDADSVPQDGQSVEPRGIPFGMPFGMAMMITLNEMYPSPSCQHPGRRQSTSCGSQFDTNPGVLHWRLPTEHVSEIPVTWPYR
ncbi:hypothetical protein Rwratislav_44066 [Rhodococcus wratislaviensis IFP 2016]|nr:hypothetical protein Rwratislav_44066 [Rhodococcus wratislaviensis IFP 2016]